MFFSCASSLQTCQFHSWTIFHIVLTFELEWCIFFERHWCRLMSNFFYTITQHQQKEEKKVASSVTECVRSNSRRSSQQLDVYLCAKWLGAECVMSIMVFRSFFSSSSFTWVCERLADRLRESVKNEQKNNKTIMMLSPFSFFIIRWWNAIDRSGPVCIFKM